MNVTMQTGGIHCTLRVSMIPVFLPYVYLLAVCLGLSSTARRILDDERGGRPTFQDENMCTDHLDDVGQGDEEPAKGDTQQDDQGAAFTHALRDIVRAP